jgi:hypothetical protein
MARPAVTYHLGPPEVVANLIVKALYRFERASTKQLYTRIVTNGETLDEGLRILRDEGTIACTNGEWWICSHPKARAHVLPVAKRRKAR